MRSSYSRTCCLNATSYRFGVLAGLEINPGMQTAHSRRPTAHYSLHIYTELIALHFQDQGPCMYPENSLLDLITVNAEVFSVLRRPFDFLHAAPGRARMRRSKDSDYRRL